MSDEAMRPDEAKTSSEMKWYVVHTYSGYENKVKANIEKTIENRGMQDQILEVSVPLQEVVELKKRSEKNSTKKSISGICTIKNDYE